MQQVAFSTVSMSTRDGVRLDADVYRPAGEGPLPVLLMRQPYGRKIASTVVYAHPRWYAAHGYIVAIQDVRGAGTSKGAFKLFEHERADGADAVAWAAALEGGNGRVGMYGFSYQAATQLLALAGALDSRRAEARRALSGHDGLGRLLRLGLRGRGVLPLWRHVVGPADGCGTRPARGRCRGLHRDAGGGQPPLYEERMAWPAVLQRFAQYTHYGDWIGNPAPGDYWDRISPKAALAGRIDDVRTLHVGGWYDKMLEGTLGAWQAMAASRAPQRLVVGPWGHIPWGRRAGIIDFGPEASSPVDVEQLRWFDRFLKDQDNGIEREPPVRLFDVGAKAWRDLVHWPNPQPQAWHLSSKGLAAARSEDGVLDRAPQAQASLDTLVHDPWRPVPSLGGHDGQPPGPQDRGALDGRTDVACIPPRRSPSP